jgi:predicted nucleic acid-binding protein
LEEIPAIYPAWQSIVDALGVIGKQVHDARLVAVCHAHGIDQILTFNVVHFLRLSSHPPGITVGDPATVA